MIPAHVVVARVANKSRGQHTENPFESATLNLADFSRYNVPAEELRNRTLQAINESDEYSDLIEEMIKVSRILAHWLWIHVSACSPV